jgi:hypothetical protein
MSLLVLRFHRLLGSIVASRGFRGIQSSLWSHTGLPFAMSARISTRPILMFFLVRFLSFFLEPDSGCSMGGGGVGGGGGWWCSGGVVVVGCWASWGQPWITKDHLWATGLGGKSDHTLAMFGAIYVDLSVLFHYSFLRSCGKSSVCIPCLGRGGLPFSQKRKVESRFYTVSSVC